MRDTTTADRCAGCLARIPTRINLLTGRIEHVTDLGLAECLSVPQRVIGTAREQAADVARRERAVALHLAR